VRLRRILAILGKDLRDAGRDGRIIVLLLLPIGMAIFYNATFDDGDTLPTTKVAIVEQEDRRVARELRDVTGKSVDVKVRQADDESSARRLVAENDVALAVVVGPTPQDGPARAQVLLGEEAPAAAQSVVALVPEALTRAAGGEPTAETKVRRVAAVDQKPYQMLEPRTLAVLIVIVLLVTFVAMMIVPIQTAEELETGTFGALRLAVAGEEILAAKALAGLVYTAVGVGLTVLITKLDLHAPLLFFGAAFALTISLVGFGLLLGLLVPNSNAINSYGSFLLFPFVGLAAAVFFVDSGVFATVLDLLPFSQAAKLLGDGLSAESPFDAGLLSWAVIAVWALLGYGALTQISSRREL